MRKASLLTVLSLALLLSAVAAWAATARFVPPAEPGHIWTVINFRTANGKAQPASVSVSWDRARKTIIVPAPSYASPCLNTTPSGFVFRLRHANADSVPLTITTTGTIVRGPYQGEPPLELLHACYKLVK
jgi:hypothetical protein